jgi:hypothetical protein
LSILQKSLAPFLVRAQARAAMKETTRPRVGAFVAICLGLAFAWTLVLSVSPRLHQQIHGDAKQVDHTCAVTFITSGSYEHSEHPPLAGEPAQANQFSNIPALTSHWVESPFLLASIFEHAPPANS